MNNNGIAEILTRFKTVAIIGLSRDPSKDSYRVAEYLKNHGFQIVPINLSTKEVLGETSFRSLLDMPIDIQKTIEIVDIFRPSAEVPSIVDQAIRLRKMHCVPNVVWMQLGITDKQAAENAEKAGFIVVMDKCMMREHQRLSSRA